MHNETTSAIEQQYTDYVQAFESLEANAILPFYDCPCMFITPQMVLNLDTPEKLEQVLGQVVTGLRAQGYVKSVVADVSVQPLAIHLALLQARLIRYGAEDAELERMGLTYLYRKVNEAWKITVITVHDYD